MERIKSWLKSWIFWLIVSIILLVVLIVLSNGWKVGDDWLFVIMLLVEAAVVMLLLNLSRKNWMKVLLTVLISSVSALFLFSISSMLGIYPDFFEEILIPLLLALIIPSGAMTLLKLVWKK